MAESAARARHNRTNPSATLRILIFPNFRNTRLRWRRLLSGHFMKGARAAAPRAFTAHPAAANTCCHNSRRAKLVFTTDHSRAQHLSDREFCQCLCNRLLLA